MGQILTHAQSVVNACAAHNVGEYCMRLHRLLRPSRVLYLSTPGKGIRLPQDIGHAGHGPAFRKRAAWRALVSAAPGSRGKPLFSMRALSQYICRSWIRSLRRSPSVMPLAACRFQHVAWEHICQQHRVLVMHVGNSDAGHGLMRICFLSLAIFRGLG